ncbi:6,7-dimethyl-8-ribityllumazine synthase [Aerococcus vaginalis]
MKTFEGKTTAEGMKVAIVVARFNQLITEKLLAGAVDTLKRAGVADDDIAIAWTPGAYEIPVAADKLAKTGDYDAVICLGAVIKGETDHYDHVAGNTASGITRVGLDNELPVLFGVLTCETIEQAMARAGLKAGNKGIECAQAAIEMANMLKTIEN